MPVRVIPWAYPTIRGQASNGPAGGVPDVPQVEYLNLANYGFFSPPTFKFVGDGTLLQISARIKSGTVSYISTETIIETVTFSNIVYNDEKLPDVVFNKPIDPTKFNQERTYTKNLEKAAVGPKEGIGSCDVRVTIQVVNAVGNVLQSKVITSEGVELK